MRYAVAESAAYLAYVRYSLSDDFVQKETLRTVFQKNVRDLLRFYANKFIIIIPMWGIVGQSVELVVQCDRGKP